MTKEYRVICWWHADRMAAEIIEADSPQEAMAKLKDLAEGDTDWISHNEECENSDGANNYEVWDSMDRVVAEELSDSERLNQAAPDLLGLVKRALEGELAGTWNKAARAAIIVAEGEKMQVNQT